MASEDKRRKIRRVLADCTNTITPTHRRSCSGKGNDEPKQGQRSTRKKFNRVKQPLSNDSENHSHFSAEVSARCSLSNSNNSDDPTILHITPLEDREDEDSARDEENIRTPQAILPAVDSFRYPEGNDEGGFQDYRVYSKRRLLEDRTVLSCPPLGRTFLGSAAVERSQKYRDHGAQIWKRRSTYLSSDFCESGMPERVELRRISMPAHGRKYSLPEDFICQQQAHFAEVDAFVLQEEDLSDSD
eukprot:Gb_26916 [translate_table: standard]